MFHPIYDDPEVKIARWEQIQAKVAGLSVDEWRQRPNSALAQASSQISPYEPDAFSVLAVVFAVVVAIFSLVPSSQLSSVCCALQFPS